MGDEWYVARDGEQYGPFTPEQMSAGVREGQLRREDLVWCAGMPEWQPASEVAGLWLPPALRSPAEPVATARSVEPESVPAATDPPQGRPDDGVKTVEAKRVAKPRSGFILLHWRGELPLAQAYWVVGFLFTLLAIWLANVFGTWLDKANLPPVGLGITLLSFLSFLCLMTVWQLIGVWRSAGKHMKTTGRHAWGMLARLAVLLGAVRAIGDFGTVIWPMISESAILASGKDNTPAHQLRLMRNGTEVELAGGMPFGTADALKKLLDAAPGVQIVHLNSIGGRVAEGYVVYQMLRERKLATYTATDCVSACTIAFLGGSQRYLSTKARLGFHSSNFGGVDQRHAPMINDEWRRMLAAHGAPSWFIDKALSTSADSMWHPTNKDLIAAKIVTRIVDPDQFAMSGIVNWRDTEGLERGLESIPLYALIRDNDPDSFKRIASRLADGVKLGKSMAEVVKEMQAEFSVLLPKYLEVAPDDAILRYYRVRVAEMEHFAKTNPALCVALEFPERRPDDFNLTKLVPAAIFEEELAAITGVVREAIRSPQRQKTSNVADEFAGAIERVSKRIPSAQQVLTEPDKHFDDPRRLCAALLVLYSEVLSLPPLRAGPMLRSLSEPSR